MTQSLQSFVKGLSDSGLMSAEEATALCVSTGANSAESFANSLVQQKRLTKYQAKILWDDSGEPLVIASYELLSKLGEGGMGQVFRARHRTMKREVALKVLPPDKPQLLQRFQRQGAENAMIADYGTPKPPKKAPHRHFRCFGTLQETTQTQ